MSKSHKSTMPCGGGPLELPRYFPRQLITPDDLTQEQEYFRHRLRLHNRMLWGWGTVCGTQVCRIPLEKGSAEQDPWKVMVKPGYLLGPFGDDILITAPVIVDLRTGGVAGAAGDECVTDEEAADPWCSRVCLTREPGPRWIAVRYAQCLTRPVKVQPAGCGCGGDDCEYSRLRDGFEIGILDRCPDSHRGKPPSFERLFEGGIPDCPECPEDPWVVLAKVDLTEGGIEGEPDNCSCRRLTVSFAHLWWRCGDKQPPPEPEDELTIRGITSVGPNGNTVSAPISVIRGATVPLTITGGPFTEEVALGMPGGFDQAAPLAVEVNRITTQVKVSDAAPFGMHGLKITQPGFKDVFPEEVFNVPEVSGEPVTFTPAVMEEVVVRFRNNREAPAELPRARDFNLTVNGSNFQPGSRIAVGDGFEIADLEVTEDKITATLKVLDGAPAGPQRLRLLSPSGDELAAKPDAFAVEGGRG